MKTTRMLFALFCLLVFLGCDKVKIPEGKYVSSDGQEYLAVNSSTIFYHILTSDYPPVVIEKEYNYSMDEKGDITPYTMTSAEYFHWRFRFHWDGKNITAEKSFGKKETVVFHRIIEAASQKKVNMLDSQNLTHNEKSTP